MKKKTKQPETLAVVHIQGPLTISTIEEAEKKWISPLSNPIQDLALDFSRVSFIDSTAIGALVKLLNLCNNRKVRISLFNIPQPVQDMFDAVKLGDFFTILTQQDFDNRFNQ